MEFRQEAEIQTLLKELVMIKARIARLLLQARQGLTTIQDAKVELARQTKEVEEQKEKIAKLDHWLESINNELKESTTQSDVLTEEDIIRYIEIYERYLREYEEYEIIIRSVIVTIRDDSSQLKEKLYTTSKTLEQTRNLVITEIERLRQILIHLRTVPEVEIPLEEDISQTDRTIDSTSMPEEIVTPREPELVKHEGLTVESAVSQKSVPASDQESIPSQIQLKIKEAEPSKFDLQIKETEPIQISFQTKESTTSQKKEIMPNVTIETQTGKSLMSDAPSLVDKSVICKPEENKMIDVSITCAPPQEVEVQTSDSKLLDREMLENIQVKQTISEGHETIEIASRPFTRDQTGEQSLFVDAHYKDNNLYKDSQLNITHSLPQSFETVMVEPDETTTEVVVDADGTKRIIVKKVRKTLVTRQQVLQTQKQHTQILSSDSIPQDQSFNQLTLHGDQGSSSTALDDSGTRHIQYQTYGGQMISMFPGSEVSIQEITSKPDMIITMEQGMKPEEILQLAEGEIPPLVQTSSSSVTAVVQQVTKRIIKTRRRIIRRVVIIDGKEHVTEEVIEEPDSVEMIEEQIPRVSINVKDSAFTSEVGDDADDKGQPPKKLSDQEKDDKSYGGDDKFDKDEQDKLQKLTTSDFHKNDLETLADVEQPSESSSRISQVQYQTKEFLQGESLNENQSQAIPQEETITISKSYLPDDSKQMYSPMYDVETPFVGQTGIYTTQITSNTETSSNMATVVQKVTRKLTRTRKRIIKHIQIIDGKEHVTEEVIEEPEEVEIVEDEPQISHFVQNQGKTRRIKLIRQIEMIDGKEHITEQMVEESDDEPDDSIVPDKSTIKLDRPDITEIVTQETNSKNVNKIDASKLLIERETGGESKLQISPETSDKTTTKPFTKVTRIRKRIIKHIKVIDGKEHVTEEVIEEPDEENVFIEEPNVAHVIQEEGVKTKRIKIIRQVNIIDGKEHVTERILEDTDDEYVPDSTVIAEINVDIDKPDQENSGLNQITLDKANQHLINITKSLIGNEIDQSTVLKSEVSLTEAMTPISERSVQDKQITEKPSVISSIYDSAGTKKLNEQSLIYKEEPVLKEQHDIEQPAGTDIITLKTIDEYPLTMETKTRDKTDTNEKMDIIHKKALTDILDQDQSLIDLTKKLIQSETIHGTTLHPSVKAPVKISKEVLSSEQRTVIEPNSPTIEILETKGQTDNLLETKASKNLNDPIKETVVSEDVKLKKVIKSPSKLETEKDLVIDTSEDKKPEKLAKYEDLKASDHFVISMSKNLIDNLKLEQPAKSSAFEITESEVNKTDMTGIEPNKLLVHKDLVQTGLDPQTYSLLKSEEQTTTKILESQSSTPVNIENSSVSEQKLTELSELNKITEEPKQTENVMPEIIPADVRKVPEDTSIDISRSLIESEIDHSMAISPKVYIAAKKDTVAPLVQEDRSQNETCIAAEQTDILLQHSGLKNQDDTEDQQKVSTTPTFDETKYIKYTEVDKGVLLEKPTVLSEDKPSQSLNKQIEDESILTPSVILHPDIKLTKETATVITDIPKILPSETEAEKYKAMIDTTKDLLQSEVDRSSFEIAKEIKPSAPSQEIFENKKKEYNVINPEIVSPKVTKIVTRTKKRLIKHIQIVDGKEYVTEEVIEEPDETEIFEQEPSELMTLQEQGVRTKQIRIVRTVQIVDGKEHVSEPIIEEPDDEYVPDSTVTAEINVQLTHEAPSKSGVQAEYVTVVAPDIKTDVKDIEEIKDFPRPFSEAPILNVTKELLENESNDTQHQEHALIEPSEKTISANEMLLKALTVQDEPFIGKKDEKINKEIDLVDKPLTCDKDIKKLKESADIIENKPSQDEKDYGQFERDEHHNAKDLSSQVPTEVELVEAATSLSNINSTLEAKKLEDVQQLKPVIIYSDDQKLEKQMLSIGLPSEHSMIPASMSSDGTISNAVKPKTEHSTAFIESERLDTHLRNTVLSDLNKVRGEIQQENDQKSSQTSPKIEELDNKIQIHEISMTIAKTDRSKKVEPKIEVGIKFEELDKTQPTVITCKKDIQACLPTEITIIEEQFNKNDKFDVDKVKSEDIRSSAEFIKEELTKESPLTAVIETPTLLVKDQEVIQELPKENFSVETSTEFTKDQLQKDHFEEYVPTDSPVELTEDHQILQEYTEENIQVETKDKKIIKDHSDESVSGEMPAEMPSELTEDQQILKNHSDVSKETPVEPKIDQQVEQIVPKQTSSELTEDQEILKDDSKVSLYLETPVELTKDSKIKEDHSSQSVPVDTPAELMEEPENIQELSTKSDHVETDDVATLCMETDKSISDTESSSLKKYVELPTPTSTESPIPTNVILEMKEGFGEPLSISTQSEPISEKGYEAEDASIVKEVIPEKKKRQKKRKSHAVSEETIYPTQTSTEDETAVSTPVEMEEPIHQRKIKTKKGKKKVYVDDTFKKPEASPIQSPEKPQAESQYVGEEIVTLSPKDESYHTISETSDINTVKIVEECVGSSPEIHKEITTTVTYPIPVVEEIATAEYSVQTSPEIQDSFIDDKIEILKETTDTELQTSPIHVSEIVIQTTPTQDKEAETQTLENLTVFEKIEVSNSQIQTSRAETPEQIIRSEVTTQVLPSDIVKPDDKFSQTSSPIMEEVKQIVEQDTREIQTSPQPIVPKEEKSTEVRVETTESDIQTMKQETTDQETLTSPTKSKEVTEISIQTPEVPLVHTFTQSDSIETIVEPKLDKQQTPRLPVLDTKVVTVDSIQQTSPRIYEEDSKPDTKQIKMIDTQQQTSPREETDINAVVPPLDLNQKEVIYTDSVQQTTPKDYIESPVFKPVKDSGEERVTMADYTQQTSPILYSEDSISTSTEEPYEVHLRAQISIPQATDSFIENERRTEQISILGDTYKQKRRKPKKKTESPLQSPGSLSDPINAELSLSVTPTSEDFSSKETSSIDEGISQLASPVLLQQESYIITQRPSYSDVVQRSKSKSPSPSKAIIVPKSGKARLLSTLEKRTQSIQEPHKITEDTMTVALFEPSVEKSYDLLVNKELDGLKNAVNSNNADKTEKCIITIIETISIWLEEIQYKIQKDIISGSKASIKPERIKDVENYIERLKEIVYITEVNEEIITLIETLTRQVHAVNSKTNQSMVKVNEGENEWDKFLGDASKLSETVEKVKSQVDQFIVSEAPTQQKLDVLDTIEIDNVANIESIRKMFRIYRNLLETNPKRECPSILYNCNDDSKQIENTINTERDRLLQLSSLAEEYEQTLQDFGQITDVAEALLDGKIIVSNLDHLHEEIQKHRKFFVNLSHCRAILESLEDNLDSETRAKYSSLHHSLHDRATIIIDRAAGRAQQMTLAASRWSVLDQGMKEEQQWLGVAQQRIPDLTNVTSIDHEQYINLYQSISLDVSHHNAKMLRLLSITEGLQGLIVCSGLETECSIALDTLLRLQEDIDSRLTRLTAFKENWVTYDYLIDRIEGWMKLANKELEQITPENITTTSNLRRFWELKAQHEVHNNLKNESGIQFEKALEILPISDEMVQRQFFSKIEDKWRDLSSRISNIHASAIQNISDRDVSSGEKLNILEDEMRELRAMLEGLKGVIKSDDELNLYIERLQVMTSRIDRIQNELGRLSLLPTAESERLGALLTQSGLLDDQIAEELERSLLLKEKIDHVQAGIARCQKNQRRARLTLEECEAAERLGSDVVERASQNCQKLLEDLSAQWRDILALRQALHTLPISLRVCVSPVSVERDISALQESHAELERACNELSLRLRSKLQLWRRFERQLELVQGAVREADYMVELLTVQGQVDYDRLLKATEKLETLSESLSRRSGELVGELRDCAAPLVASTEPGIAAKLRKELDDAAAAYEHTCSNLTQLCDRYHKAVDLWRRYREAAAGVRAFADHHEAFLHALRPHDAPAAVQACLEQEARVAELRSLAARVAAETGSRALQADADALARRLQLVAGAVQALADLGEARQLARAKAQHAKEMFCDMKQDLTPVHEDSEIVEDKLIALRDNLIALGKSEADIAPAKAELPDIDRDVSDEHSIVRILELWQAMFRDTFLHYHRLSTALVRSGDAATALRLWNEYLLDLQSFLSGSVPADYENLTEHRRLCRVHRNLLASQRSVLMNENKETKNRDLSDKFDTLTNLHNETLARIVERHDEVCTRIAAWDEYREIYTELLRWLKEIEREKEKLQLRYVHIKRIHKILAKIQNLTDKLPEGRKLSEKLLGNLKKVLEFTDDTYGASVRMEYAGIVKRVDNLQASLDTWRDFLTRILGLIGEYETLTGDLQKLYTRTQNEITSYSDEDRLSRPQLKKAIDRYTDLRKKIDRTETQIEALSVIQEQLKECLSPQDIRVVNQKVWQLRQQRADLEHQLSIIIHRLQERLEIYTIFDSRLSRFAEWMTILESRLETTTSTSDIGALDPQDLIRRISSDIQAETAMKEREFEWLTETGSALVDLSKKDEKSYSKNTSKHIKDVQERWHRLQETGRSRIAKINELLETITQLEERLTEIRLRLHSIEANLSAPVVLEHLTTKAVDSKFQERDEIHKDIENESGEVGKTLNLCELIFNDPNVLKGNFDLRNLHTGVDIVEKKWKNICDMSEQRKKALKEIRKSAELANSLLPKVEKKLDAIEKRVEKIETRKQRGEAEDESVSKAVIKDLDNLEGDIKKLEDAYSRVASARGIELRGHGADDAARLRGAVRRWQQLRGRVDAAGADAHRQFVAAHGKAVVSLAEADVRLTRALHLAPTPTDKMATLKELDGVEEDLRDCEALVDDADRLSVAVTTVAGVADMVAEYRALFADVRTRLELARAEVVGDVDTAVQVDTLKWETDAALQVDTLTSKETYRVELASAVRETSESLETLRTALLHEVKENAGSDELATAAKEIAKAGVKPEQTLELAKHLSELLLTECDATEEEAMLKEVESLSLRYEDLLAQAKKRELQINNLRLPHSASYALTCEHESGRLTCPLCSDRNWKQLDNDLWRLEQWLQFAEATDEARTDPPEQYDALEDAIQDHREFLLDLDSHKALVVSLNVVGSHVTRHAKSADDGHRVQERLVAANQRWDRACSKAAAWQGRLQTALVHNREFHDIVIELVAQLAAAERTVRAREPLRLTRPPHELRKDFRRFSELRDELSRAEPRVLALRDAAQLLKGADAQDVCRRLGELRLRLQSLRKLSGVYALKLGAALARHPPHAGALAAAAAAPLAATQLTEEDDDLPPMSLPPLDENDVILSEEREEQELGRVQRGLRFVCRVARASLPFQALLLLLLGAAALAPLSPHGDCRTPGASFQPVLRYPHGPPPL